MCFGESTEASFDYEEDDSHNDLQLMDSDGALSDDTTQYIEAATPLVLTATSNPNFSHFSHVNQNVSDTIYHYLCNLRIS